jgi:chromosome segregation ATPase
MSQDQNSMGAPAIPGRTSESNGAPPPMGRGGNDSFLSSLAELENRIGSLKAMHEQASSREVEFSDRERKLAEREAALTEKERSIAATVEGLEKTKTELDERSRAVAARADEMTSRDSAIAQREAAFTSTESSLAEREKAAQGALDDARKSREEVDQLSRQLAEREAALADQNADIMRREDSIEMKLEGAERLREQIMSRGAEIAAREAKIAKELTELKARAAQFDKQTAERQAGIDRAEADLTERERSLSARAVKAEAELNRIAGEQEEIDEARAEVDAARAGLDSTREEVDHARTELDAARAGLDSARDEIDRARAEVESRDNDMTERKRMLDAKAAKAEAEATRIAKEQEALDASLTELDARTTQFERQSANRQAEFEKLKAEMAQREQSLAAKATKAEAERKRVAQEQEKLDDSRKSVESARKEVDQARTEIERRDKDIAERARALADNRTALESDRAEGAARIRADEEALRQREQQIHEREIDLATTREELDRERAGVAEHARTLAAQLTSQADNETAAIWNNRVEHMQIELGQKNADKARLETEVAQLRQNIEKLTQELIDANQNRGVPDKELQSRDRRIAEMTSALEESRAIANTLQDRIDTLEKTVKDATEIREREIAGRDDQIRAHSERLAAHSRQLDEALQRAEQADAEKGDMVPRSVHDRVEQELAAARELLDQADAASRDRVPADELRQRDETIANLETAVREAEKAATELARQDIEAKETVIADLRKRLEEAATESAGSNSPIAREFARVSEEAEELRERLRTAEKTLNDAGNADALAERDQVIAELREKIESLSQSGGSAAANEGESSPEAAELRSRLDQALTEIEALRSNQNASSDSPEGGPTGPTPAELLRRDRLRRYKSLLQTQARKIVTAQSALQRRHADCEMVLTNRSRLAELAQQLARAEKKLTAGKARSGAATALMYMVVTLGIIAGLSWEVSKRIWPGTYIARCVLEADSGRRTPSADDLSQWQKDHKELLSDPRLMEMAAERMQRRGLAQTADPAGLAARLKDDMYVQSARPGSITVELRGEGAEKTALYLDTFATSFKAFADQSRDERTNDIGVTIAQAATPGAEPLMDKRIERAGGIFGGAVLAAGLAGLVIFSRLVRAKRKFDHAAAVEAALEEVDWSTLEASIRKHSPKDAAKA